jgi:uncharacterized protein
MNRITWIFLLLAYAISWAISEIGFYFFPNNPRAYLVIAVMFMYGPAIAAVIATKLVVKKPLQWLGPIFSFNKFVLLAAVLPLIFTFLHLMLSALLPDLSINLDSAGIAANILTQVPEAQRAEIGAALHQLGDWLPLLMLAQVVFAGLIAGMTVNAVAAFGEELGWRGFMYHSLAGMGLWKKSMLIGFFWGLWHAPLILRGHNFPDNPQWGLLLMIVFCMALSPLFEFVRQRGGSVLAASWMHGVMNATGGASVVFVSGSDFMRGPAGVAGIAALIIMNIALWLHLRKNSALAFATHA